MPKRSTRKLIGAGGQEITESYTAGNLKLADTKWQAFTIRNGMFTDVGEPFIILGEDVSAEMDAARSIKGHEPCHLALKKAREMYPDDDIRGVTQLYR